jgi:hypothetical protein
MKWHIRLEIVGKEVTLVYITFFRRVEEQHGGSAKYNFNFQFIDDNAGITKVIHTKFGLEIRDKRTYTLRTKCFENQGHFKQGHVTNL